MQSSTQDDGFSTFKKPPVPEPAYFGFGLVLIALVVYYLASHRNKRPRAAQDDESWGTPRNDD